MTFQNCSGGLTSKSSQLNQVTSANSDGLDTAQPNQKPVVNCSFTSLQRSDVYMNVSTLNDQFSAERFNEDDSLSVDCSGTTDESAFSQLTLEIDQNYNSSSPNFQPLMSSSFTLNPGLYPMAIRATDPQGETTVKTFNMVVTCNDRVSDPVVGNLNNLITASEGSAVGLYDFNITTSEISGGQSFEFAWDFNGDGVWDPFGEQKTGTKQLWSDIASRTDIYVNAQNSVQVGLQIRNECFRTTTVNVDVNLANSHPVTAASPASPQGYYYVQGEMRDTGGSANALETQRKTRDYLATNNEVFREFTCDYKGPRNGSGSIEIRTLKQYRDEDFSIHGLNLDIVNIPDDGSDGTFSVVANIQSMTAVMAGESDGISDDRFNRMSGCNVSLTIVRATSTTPCQTGPDRRTGSIEYYGEFNCPTLMNSNGSTMAVNNGRFYCGEAISDRCQGGGGGGGGQPPPQF